MKQTLLVAATVLMCSFGYSQSAQSTTGETAKPSCAAQKGKPSCCAKASKKSCGDKAEAKPKTDAKKEESMSTPEIKKAEGTIEN